MGSTYYLFQRAERVEWLSARVYGALKERFRENPEAHALFVRLEAEEEQHAKRVRLLAAHYFRDRTLTVEADPRELDLCISECERALLEVESGAWGTDVDEVKRRCLALEERLVRAHADLLTRHADSPLRDFLAQLAYMDMAHVQLLAES